MNLNWRNGFEIEVRIEDGAAVISANREGLLSLAGHLHATGETKEFTMPGTKSTAVEIAYQLETPVQEALYEYIVG